ncbi:MAG: DUF3800 domain-containing protein [Clostridiales bacterium]|nr:DUF3800 domain-containing protein [Clostridiales bacterium]
MKDLSVFCDESGDFGAYENHSPYYIVTLVFHDQSINIAKSISLLNTKIHDSGFPDYTIHTGPLIRREDEYFYTSLIERKRIFNILYNFTRTTNITYHSLIVEKKQLVEEVGLIARISKQLSTFLFGHIEKFTQYDRVVVYYDYGQRELTSILVSVFNTILNNVEFKKLHLQTINSFRLLTCFALWNCSH